MQATKPYVGSANTRPDSLVPRRLTTVSRTTHTTDSCTDRGTNDGTADVIAATPATTDNATVST